MYLQPLLNTIGQAFSGDMTKRYVEIITRYHRIQASPDFRAAAEWVAQTLQQAGVQAQVERFPANYQTHFGVLPSFQEWECRQATLDWLRDEGSERLGDFGVSPLSVIQRSCSVSGEFTVIDVGAGRAEDYEGKDVQGKLVLSRAPATQTYRRAVEKRGAAGILFDNISATAPGRNVIDLPDARQYTSFWWPDAEQKGWGFVLTPRQGQSIRQALAAGKTVTMRAHIDAHFYDGEIEVVSATIPGQNHESLLGIAHLCHPQGFANDNASGSATLLELAIVLQKLIDKDVLAPPRRTIRFLWVPEMTGTYAWLAAHADEVPSTIAGINLDMVGEKQESTGAVLVLERPPAAMASFAPDLLESLRDTLLPEQPAFGETSRFPRICYTTSPFSGGSDHMITSDPAVGIPTPMLIQWPDRFYHTTADTLEHVDPKSLWRAGVLAGSYLYWLAQADAEEACWLGWEMIIRSEQRLNRWVQDETTRLLANSAPAECSAGWAHLVEGLEYRQERIWAAVQSLARLGKVAAWLPGWGAEIESMADRARDRSRQQIRPTSHPPATPSTSDWAKSAAQWLPLRHYWGPIMDLVAGVPSVPLDADDRVLWQQLYDEVPNWRVLRAHAEYWADGKRSLADIARLVELETGQALGPQIQRYFRLLAKAGLMSLQKTPSLDQTRGFENKGESA